MAGCYVRGTPIMLAGGNPLDSHGSADQAIVYIRPHMLDVHLGASNKIGLPATIRRINAAGPRAKLELESDWGDPILVEIEHARSVSRLILASI